MNRWISRMSKWMGLLAILALLLAPLSSVQAAEEAPKADPNLLQWATDHPDAVFPVIVQRDVKQKDLPDEEPEQAVMNGGGLVKKQLTMIESFSAELTGKEILKLAKHKKVRWISFDAPLVSTAAGDPTVRDEFDTAAFSNNNGTRAWAGNWTEAGDGTSGATSGYVRISAGSLQLSSTNRTFSRSVDLTGAVLATLSYDYKRSSFDDANDYVAIQVSADGGATWTEVARHAGPGTDSAWQTASLDIHSYAAANTQIRFATSSSLGWWDILVVDNVEIESASASKYVATVRADQLWANLKGQGVTVAVVDSGITSQTDLKYYGNSRIIASTNQTNATSANDGDGHGTFVAGIIGGNGSQSGGAYSGVAPRVNLVNVKVSNDVGSATTSDLVDGLQWIKDNQATYNIKVVNISLNSTVAESYHSSPLDAAVEILWFNGIVVVVAAGNNGTGSGPVTLYAPANDPFVITVGATDDKGTPGLSDDAMAVFSAYGTTEDSFAKPDLVAPGRNLIGLLASTSATCYVNHPAHRIDTSYFRMSGTSMAAPVVSGAVALLLQDEPGLTPDQVKYRLKATANTAWPGYDAAKAGAGYLDIYAAVYGTTTQSANTDQVISTLLATGSGAVNSAVNWNSVNWNSVNWNSVNWNSVNWNSVNWNSINWNSAVWDD